MWYHFIDKVNEDIENENIQLEKIQKNAPLLHHYGTLQLCDHQRKIENSHLSKSTYSLDKFLQEEMSFLRKELANKQKTIAN